MNIVGDPENFKQPYDNDDDYISKTSFKKESAALQELGKKLLPLSPTQLQKLDVSESMYDALLAAKKIKPNTEAFRRHQQLIGKLMRNEDIDAVQSSLDSILNKNNNEAARIGIFEKLRDKLLAEGDTAIQALLDEHPSLDRQKLRQLVRSAKKELDKGASGKNHKELFKYLRQEIE